MVCSAFSQFDMEAYKLATNLSLIIQPGDSFFPIVDAIDGATSSIKMTIFRMNDPIVREAMTYAVSRGVKVQALVAPQSKGWTKRNKKLSDELSKVGIEVRVPRARKEKIKRERLISLMNGNSPQPRVPSLKELYGPKQSSLPWEEHQSEIVVSFSVNGPNFQRTAASLDGFVEFPLLA